MKNMFVKAPIDRIAGREKEMVFRNYEEAVIEELASLLKDLKDVCKCEKCRQDIVTYTLNRMLAKYVVTDLGNVYTKLNQLKAQSRADIIVKMMEAAKIVKETRGISRFMLIETKDPYLEKILDKIQEERNLDFSQYRGSILGRRVMARVRMTKQDSFEQYLAYLRLHPEEMDYLMDAMTINVTEFFRDAFIFDVIEKEVIPEIFREKQRLNSGTIRIWSCGCADGSEVISMLILIAEYLNEAINKLQFSIIGTDIDLENLTRAKEAVYEEGRFENMEPHLRGKYFQDMGNKRYRLKKEYSKYIHYKFHDIVNDKPFTHLDLIICRNLFIYLNVALQERILATFHKALARGGFLILGLTRHINPRMTGGFSAFDADNRIYRKP